MPIVKIPRAKNMDFTILNKIQTMANNNMNLASCATICRLYEASGGWTP